MSLGVFHKFLLYCRTARYLKLVQVLNRVTRHIPTVLIDCRDEAQTRVMNRQVLSKPARASLMKTAKTFVFLNEFGQLDDLSGWQLSKKSRLWLYNLHYFDDLLCEEAVKRIGWHRDLIKDWVQKNPSKSKPAWEPYPTSRRIVNWVFWDLQFGELNKNAQKSLYLQAEWLFKNLEFHLLGNHLLANIKGLLFASTYFETNRSLVWQKKAEKLLLDQISEQILGDGGHFEQSPMYHALIIEDFLDLLNLDQAFPGVVSATVVSRLKASVKAMLDWLRVMSHPDGKIAQFNDSALGISLDLSQLHDYAKALDLGIATTGSDMPVKKTNVTILEESGYCVVCSSGLTLFMDVGEIKCDYIPGHSHADALSMELSFGDERIFVNSGISTYEVCEQRIWERGSESHNNLTLGGQNSAEVWSSFRVGRRPQVNISSLQQNQEIVSVSANHNGYRYKGRKCITTRSVTAGHGRISIQDKITPPLPAKVRFLLHPSCHLEETDVKNVLKIKTDTGETLRAELMNCNCVIEPAFYSSGFNKQCATSCVVLECENGLATLDLYVNS